MVYNLASPKRCVNLAGNACKQEEFDGDILVVSYFCSVVVTTYTSKMFTPFTQHFNKHIILHLRSIFV